MVLFLETGKPTPPDKAALEAALAGYPGVAERRVSLAVWGQWLGKGVLR